MLIYRIGDAACRVSTNVELHQKLIKRQVCRGLWCTLPCPSLVRLVARLAFDWICVDAEHGPMSVETVAAMIAAGVDARAPVVVRVAANTALEIKRALDAGATGVIAPMVNDRHDAQALVSAARFPPLGSRSHGSPWAGLPWSLSIVDYPQQTRVLVIAQVETTTALGNLHEIMGTSGLDAVFVGPVDLSLSLGVHSDDQLVPSLTEIQRIADIYEMPTGIFCPTSAVAHQHVERGYRLVTIASDVGLLLSGAHRELGE